MKSTKTLLIAALAAGALIVGGSALRAQDSTNTPPVPEHAPGMKPARHDIAKELNLTEDQKPKFQEITKGAMEKRKALREDASLTPEEKKAKAKAIQEETSTQLKALLTPEQFTKWQEATKRGPRKPGVPPPSTAAQPPN